MRIIINKIENPVILSDSNGIQETRFDINFNCNLCQHADAYLKVVHTSSEIDLVLIRKAVSNHRVGTGASVDGVYDFGRVDGRGIESLSQINLNKHFYFEGTIVKFLSAGQGFVFKAGDFEIILDLRIIPENFPDEDLDPGKWICFKAERLYLWPPFQ
jgi:hypothetical protein